MEIEIAFREVDDIFIKSVAFAKTVTQPCEGEKENIARFC